jgi:hypothetical protein
MVGVWFKVGSAVGIEVGWLNSSVGISGAVVVGPTDRDVMLHPTNTLARINMKMDFSAMVPPKRMIVIDRIS